MKDRSRGSFFLFVFLLQMCYLWQGRKKGAKGCFLNLNPNEKMQILCVQQLSEHPWQIRLLIHKCPDLCLCNYAYISDSFVAGFCVGVGLRGWMCVLATQISHSIENASFFPLF